MKVEFQELDSSYNCPCNLLGPTLKFCRMFGINMLVKCNHYQEIRKSNFYVMKQWIILFLLLFFNLLMHLMISLPERISHYFCSDLIYVLGEDYLTTGAIHIIMRYAACFLYVFMMINEKNQHGICLEAFRDQRKISRMEFWHTILFNIVVTIIMLTTITTNVFNGMRFYPAAAKFTNEKVASLCYFILNVDYILMIVVITLIISTLILFAITVKGNFDDLTKDISAIQPHIKDVGICLKIIREKYEECRLRLEELNIIAETVSNSLYCTTISITSFFLYNYLNFSHHTFSDMMFLFGLIVITITTISISMFVAEISVSAVSPLIHLKKFCNFNICIEDQLKLICSLKLLNGQKLGIKCLDFTFTKLSLFQLIKNGTSFYSSLKQLQEMRYSKKCSQPDAA